MQWQNLVLYTDESTTSVASNRQNGKFETRIAREVEKQAVESLPAQTVLMATKE